MNNGIAAVELGTTKVTVLVGRLKQDGMLALLGLGSAAYEQRDSTHIKPLESRQALKMALGQAQKMTGFKINKCILGVPNEYCGLQQTQQSVSIGEGGVTKVDIHTVRKATGSYTLPPEWQITQVIYGAYLVDGEPVPEPLGAKGHSLSLSASLICINRTFVKDAIRLLSLCGIKTEKVVPVLSAQGDIFLSAEERKSGGVLIDVGAYSTDIAVYHGGIPVHYDWIPKGGASITSDIARGIGMNDKDAEKLKRNCILGLDVAAGSSEGGMDYTVRQGAQILNIPADLLQTIVESRVEELLETIAGCIRSVPSLVQSDAIVVLTGGGIALLRGAKEFSASQLGLPVRLGVPDCVGLSSPSLAGAYALVCSRVSAYGQNSPRVLTEIKGALRALFQ